MPLYSGSLNMMTSKCLPSHMGQMCMHLKCYSGEIASPHKVHFGLQYSHMAYDYD